MLNLRRPDARAVAVAASLAVVLGLGATTPAAGQAVASIWSGSRPHPAPVPRSLHQAGNAGAGNLNVVVPPVPPRRDLRELCTILLSDPGGHPGAGRHSRSEGSGGADRARDEHDTIPDLVAATGGSRASAIRWCLNYLHPHRGKPHREKVVPYPRHRQGAS
jgi:hypothetical protein